jgi:hypothetical protein
MYDFFSKLFQNELEQKKLDGSTQLTTVKVGVSGACSTKIYDRNSLFYRCKLACLSLSVTSILV